MTRTKLADRALPNYSRVEEMINSVSHSAGGLFGVYVLIRCIAISVKGGGAISLVSSIIYGISMIFLYSMSSVYHGLRISTAKKVFQIIDHCAVFVLIAGSYTPLLLCTVREYSPVTAYSLLAIVWGVTVVGIVFNSIDLNKYKAFSMVCYIIVGWLIVIELGHLNDFLGSFPVLLIFWGGICYTVGAIIYGVGKKKKYFHCVFHFFVLAGSVLQYISISSYIL